MRISDWSSDVCSFDLVTKSLTIHGVLANRSKSMSDQRRALLLPQELMQFPDSELLLLRGGISPIHGEKIRYYADGLFRARVEPAPEVPPIPRTLRDDEIGRAHV